MKVTGATTLATTGLLVASSAALAAPTQPIKRTTMSSPIHVPITKRNIVKRTGNDLLEWAYDQKSILQSKYRMSATTPTRRAGSTSLTNVQYDSSWVATISGGTPSKDYQVVLDTGSADLWIGSDYYNPSSSSSFQNQSTAFDIQYGSGEVAGYDATDSFTLAGTTVDNLHFAVAEQVSSGLTSSAMEGIMGMAFQALASSKEPPLWVAANIDTFSFYLERASLTSQDETQPGGTFTLGGTNSSLYQGDISYNSLIEQLYWMIRLGAVGTKGSDVDLDSLTHAAIDTGTTLIGGPDSVVQELYSQIPNSKSQGNGYYSYPCSSSVEATLTFGDQQYTIPDSDFSAGTLDQSGSECLGAFFGLGSTSQTDLQWIIGDAFLKNVYTVFTTNANSSGAAVGFASLASGLNSGTTSKTVSTSTSTSTGSSSSSAAKTRINSAVVLVGTLLPLLALLIV
ncbi:related to aspartic protease [Melanopsichium pennsylvanicum]|uniref:Related to aspartic protease n=2 Tax=Melanopsichium pennsylvanicum TaxID=63383 RepID=A0AAJ4XNA3_9BASI|nr:related to aspartic protease [Melanopsichium pennsylvanicum 4]SNX85474.1 related to aspartic protease [Melanopsichium pennsylvanicum]